MTTHLEVLKVALGFIGTAGVLAYAGYRLVSYATIIAEKTVLGATFVGAAMLATITSLPELASGVGAVFIAKQPDLAVGDALGSCTFNLLVFLMLELLHPKESIYARASQHHALAAGLGTILIALVGTGIVVERLDLGFSFAHVGIMTPVIGVAYLIALWMIYVHARSERPNPPRANVPIATSVRAAVAGYFVSGAFVVAAGLALPVLSKALAEIVGWNSSFVGTTLLAFSTSLPEIVVSVAAIRIGALDMAVANLVGSNLFDTVIIAIDDLLYTKGSILADVSITHIVTALSSIGMTGIVVAALLFRPTSYRVRRPFLRLGWASVFLLLIYLANAYIQYSFGMPD